MRVTLDRTAAVAPQRKERRPVVIGIDPGLERTGYAVCRSDRLIEAGVVRLDTGAPLAERLGELAEAIRHLLDTRRPEFVACESLYAHYKHPRTAILMGHARGVILAEAARSGILVVHVGATQVKKALTGNGHAGKRQMQQAVSSAFGIRRLIEPHDASDAAAVALCGVQVWLGRGRLRSGAGRGGG